eukprot:FR743326.1.p1 GENE.FR743326.1~~FR743326.1.p1  ORF type:complete len:111 (+),score=6.64 FR743326.1:1303-1635(+)
MNHKCDTSGLCLTNHILTHPSLASSSPLSPLSPCDELCFGNSDFYDPSHSPRGERGMWECGRLFPLPSPPQDGVRVVSVLAVPALFSYLLFGAEFSFLLTSELGRLLSRK